jgi:hypothetical protein
MALLEVGGIEAEVRDGFTTFVVIPGIGEQDTSHIPEKGSDCRHESSTELGSILATPLRQGYG